MYAYTRYFIRVYAYTLDFLGVHVHTGKIQCIRVYHNIWVVYICIIDQMLSCCLLTLLYVTNLTLFPGCQLLSISK